MAALWATLTTAVAKGRQLKHVTCDHCGAQFVYVLERSVSTQSTAIFDIGAGKMAEAAQAASRRNLARLLDRDTDPVPCPSCGQYQEHMVAQARDVMCAPLRKRGIPLVIGGPFLAMYGLLILFTDGVMEKAGSLVSAFGLAVILLVAAVPITAAGVLYLLALKKIKDTYDPNAGPPEQRLEIARSRAMLLEEYNAFMSAKSPVREGSVPENTATQTPPKID